MFFRIIYNYLVSPRLYSNYIRLSVLKLLCQPIDLFFFFRKTAAGDLVLVKVYPQKTAFDISIL